MVRATTLTAIGLAALASGCAADGPPPLSGADMFATHCVSCHGPTGEGDGPVAAVLSVSVPNLRTLTRRNGGEFPAAAVAGYIDGRDLPAAHGERFMPVWGAVFEATTEFVPGAESASVRILAVVDYLRDLQDP